MQKVRENSKVKKKMCIDFFLHWFARMDTGYISREIAGEIIGVFLTPGAYLPMGISSYIYGFGEYLLLVFDEVFKEKFG